MAELRAWQPGYLDRLKYGIASLLGDDRQAVRDAEKLTGLLEYTPGVGDAMAGAEAVDEYNQGNYGTAGLLGAAAVAGLVPGVGDAAAKGIKKGVKAYTAPADKYLQAGPPVLKTKQGSKLVSGPHANWEEMGAAPPGTYWAKEQTPEEQLLMARKQEADAAVKAGDYDPFFDVNARYDADYSKYPDRPSTRQEKRPKTEKSIQKYAELTSAPEMRVALKNAYNAGKNDPGARLWYAMGQLEEEFIKELGPEAGRAAFKQRFADAMAATTGGMDPATNLRASAYGNYMANQGLPSAAAAGHQYPAGIGGGKHGLHGNMQQYDKLLRDVADGLSLDNPKRMNFSSNFLGNTDAATLDEQMGRILGHDKGAFNGPEYGPYEDVVAEVAAELGITPRELQEVAWSGFKLTNEKGFDRAKPMIEIFNESLARTSKMTGESQGDVLKRFIRGTGPLYGIAGAAMLPGLLSENDGPSYQGY